MPEITSVTNQYEAHSVAYFIQEIKNAFGTFANSALSATPQLKVTSLGELPSAFAVTELATASIASAGQALSELIAHSGTQAPSLQIDRRLSSFWFDSSVHPRGWTLPPAWDAIAGVYQTTDGWIRLHTNAPHHRAAALAVLGCTADKDAVSNTVSGWNSQDLEDAIVAQHGCAAVMHDRQTWQAHPQGQAVAHEPLIHIQAYPSDGKKHWKIDPHRPLQGIRVLDLTRIIAGPVATRFLAGYGADVLRLDPPEWDEPTILAELTIGKRCARLDLKKSDDRKQFEHLLSEADVLVHGYRADALAALGLDAESRRRINPALIDVSLNAYGHSGPWQYRRGFDSLVQMSCGIADFGMHHYGKTQPTPLPVQALDHATGYMIAAAVIRGLQQRYLHGLGSEMRLSLARTAELLIAGSLPRQPGLSFEAKNNTDHTPVVEHTVWGALQRLLPPLKIQGAPMQWDKPAGLLGTNRANWQ
ncbi:CoA transferase [Undibacterium sp. Dicai25W]|uniref:CoA transferase n=1 Tax=Undibacterium sp. Dicai25W TaxID=3413034 RepID=UPI003BF10FFA